MPSTPEPPSSAQPEPGPTSTGVERTSRRAWLVWGLGLFIYIVAVFDRTSLGVAAEQAAERFDIGASQFSLFVVVQLIVYAGFQVPTGVLLDRFGSRWLLVAGGLLMSAGQLLMAQATSAEVAILARVLVGIGDAMTFISVIRLLPTWFAPHQVPVMTQLTGQFGQFGQVLSAIPLTAALVQFGWAPAYTGAAAAGVLAVILVALGVRDAPPGKVQAKISRPAKEILHDLAEAFRHPGTRLGLWSHFTVQFSGMVFALMWGFPFMTIGLGYSPVLAGTLLSVMVLGSMVAGPILGRLTAAFPMRRSNLVLVVVAVTMMIWTVVLVWPGAAPVWLVVLLILVLAVNGPTSMIGFDFARTFNPSARLGSATGIVNMGGFVASLVAIFLIGVVLDSRGDAPNYTLGDFKLALCAQYLVWAFGLAVLLRARWLTRRDHGRPSDHFHQAVVRHLRRR